MQQIPIIPKRKQLRFWSALLLTLLISPDLLAEQGSRAELPADLQGVGFDQNLNHQVPLHLQFVDEHGTSVELGEYFGDKPVILVLAYYRCPMLCNMVLNGLVQGMLEVPFDVGDEFEVVTVSFDPREGWQQAAAKKRTYIERYGRPGAAEGWHFLTGEPSAIRSLTEAAGFRYKYDPEQDQFIHASGIMVLTPQGRISRYLYDVKYSGRDLRLALVEASHNQIGSAVEQVLLYCFHYDPNLGKYSASIMNLVRISGVGVLIFISAMVSFLSRSRRLRARIVGRIEAQASLGHLQHCKRTEDVAG